MTVSRPVKILALILVVAGVGGIASMSMLGKSSPAAGTSTLSVAQIRARAHAGTATAPAATTPAAAKPAAKPARHTAAPQPKPAPRPAPAKPRTPAPTTAPNGLPIVLADELHAHRIVVVSVFDPQSQTDAFSYAEARAGAADARVGFLGVSVLDDTVAGPLTASLPGGGLLPLPGTLIYRAPDTLVQRIDGFADKDSIAALALNARTAPALTAAAASASAATTTAPAAPAPVPAPAPTDTTTTP